MAFLLLTSCMLTSLVSLYYYCYKASPEIIQDNYEFIELQEFTILQK